MSGPLSDDCRGRRPAALGLVFVLLGGAVAASGADDPSAKPVDDRPTIAVAPIEPAADGDPRDAWIGTAVSEVLTRRLRRVPGVCAIPTIRLHQARQELAGAGKPDDVPLARAAAALGADYLLEGECRGHAAEMSLKLALRSLGAKSADTVRMAPSADRLFATLNAATVLVTARFPGAALSEQEVATRFGSPSDSVSAVEYFARATTAARDNNMKDAMRYALQAVDSDKRYRPALGLLAQLEMQLGRRGASAAASRLRVLSDLARKDEDALDRSSAELSLSMLAQARGASQAALTRAESALTLARTAADPHAEQTALSWIADVHVGWRDPAGETQGRDGRVAGQQAHLRAARETQQRLFDLLVARNDLLGAIPAASKLAMICDQLGDAEAAIALHKRTLDMARQLDSRGHQASAWLYLGQCYRQRQHWAAAVEAMQQCLALAEEDVKPRVRIAIASVFHAMEQPAEALAEFKQAYEGLASTDLPNQLVCLRGMAYSQKALGDHAAAAKRLQMALDIARALELPEAQVLDSELAAWREGER